MAKVRFRDVKRGRVNRINKIEKSKKRKGLIYPTKVKESKHLLR